MNFKLVNTRFVIPLGELSDKLRAKKDFVNKKRVSLNRLGFFERSLYPYCGEKHNCYRYFPFFTSLFLRENDFIYTCLVLKDCNECLHSFGTAAFVDMA